MRLPQKYPSSLERSQLLAFTLVEAMISMSLMTMVLGGVVYSHIMGMQLMQITQAKLGANDSARKALGKLQDEIRAAKTIAVGAGSSNSFIAAINGGALQGRAIQIYPGTNQNSWIRYYYLTNTSELRRVTSSSSTPQLIASYVANAVLFSKADYLGNTLTTDTGNSTINVRLEFYQLSYPPTKIGTNNVFESYQMQTCITRRTLE